MSFPRKRIIIVDLVDSLDQETHRDFPLLRAARDDLAVVEELRHDQRRASELGEELEVHLGPDELGALVAQGLLDPSPKGHLVRYEPDKPCSLRTLFVADIHDASHLCSDLVVENCAESFLR